ETVRQKIYKYFPLKKKIKILIESDNRTAYVYGYVESNEINIFSEDEESIISVLCPESYLLDVNMEHEIFSSTTSTFEFPFSAESPDYLELSTLELFYTKVITYEGDAEVGIVLKMHAIGTATNIEILNVDTEDSITIDTTKLAAIVGSGITSGDDIIISTIPGDKYAILIRSGTTYNIYNALDKYPGWFLLEKGDNTFTYDADTGVANLQFQMDYQNSYEGI
nr:phage tail family protein [Asgard group archaeon]